MTESRRRQVVRVLLDASEPLDVHQLHALTLRIQPTTINSCCYALRDAGYVGVEVALRRNKKFYVLPKRRADLEELFTSTTPK